MKTSALKDKVKFVKQALMQIFSSDGAVVEGSAAQEETIPLWSDNKFISWLNSLGIKVAKGKVPEYKDGGVGRAYLLDNAVVKFTDNPVEANVANMLVDNKNAPARIHGVYKVPGTHVYALVSDKYNMNFPKTLGHASDLFMTYLDDTGIEDYPGTESERLELAKDVAKHFSEKPFLVPYIKEVIEALFKLYKSTGFFHDDAVPQNLGMSPSGEIMVADLGPNQPRSFDPKKRLAGITSKREKLGLQKANLI